MEFKVGDFNALSQEELYAIDGGMFGVAWLTGALLAKIFAGSVVVGTAGAAAYYGMK